VADFSNRQLAGQYLDVVSTGRFMLLPYPCAQLYLNREVSAAKNNRTCASKATPDNANAAPFQYLFLSGTSFSTPTIAGVVALMLENNLSLNNADATFGTIGNPASWGPGSLERLLENSATNIPPNQVVTTLRTGVPDTECWEMGTAGCMLEATMHGWVFVDAALTAVP
jgi:Subtilase family